MSPTGRILRDLLEEPGLLDNAFKTHRWERMPFPSVIVKGDPIIETLSLDRIADLFNPAQPQKENEPMRPYEVQIGQQKQKTKPLGYLKPGEFATIETISFDPFKAYDPFKTLLDEFSREPIFGYRQDFVKRGFGVKDAEQQSRSKWKVGDLVEAIKLDDQITVIVNRSQPNAPIGDTAAFETTVRLLDPRTEVKFTVNTGE